MVIAAAMLASLGAVPSSAQSLAGLAGTGSLVRGDVTPVGWYYDGRDDARDFPSNGFFPGDFAADPASAAIGAAGLFGSTPYRSYPSQFIDGLPPGQSYCARRFRSYDPASGSFIGYDGLRHRCQ